MTKKISDAEKKKRHLNRMLKHIDDGRRYAESKKGRLISTKINEKKDYVEWECSAGHLWSQPMSSTLSNRSWCAICSGNTPRNLQVLIDIAKSRGGKVLSTEYKNVDTSYDFECSLGHKFSNGFKSVESRGQWCPTCNKGSKSEEICRTTFEQLFGFKFPKYRPEWLRNSRGFRMEIDGYCKELKIGFEYQGRQHFDYPLYGSDVKKRKADDKLKAQLCKSHGVHLFIIDYTMPYEDFPKQIQKQARKFGISLPENFSKIEVDIFKAYIRKDRISELRDLLSPKNIEVLSPKYLGSNNPVELKCLICDHKWLALGNSFFNSKRVSGCDKCVRAKAGLRNKLSLTHLQEFAEKRGGVLLSKEYVQSAHVYRWKCSVGHIFEKQFSNMKFRDEFCPDCEGGAKRKRRI
jgi:hypothetical protein